MSEENTTRSQQKQQEIAKPKHSVLDSSIGIKFDNGFNGLRFILMLVLLIMMFIVGFMNHTALNTVTIIIFIVAELATLLIPEVKLNQRK